LRRVEHRRTDPDGQLSVQPGPAGHLAPKGTPDRGDGIICQFDRITRRQWSEHVRNTRNAEKFGHQGSSQGKRLEQHKVWSELLAVAQDVVDHLVNTDLAEGAKKEVLQDSLRCDTVAGNAPSSRRKSGHVLGLAWTGHGESHASLLDDRRCTGPRRHKYLVPARRQRADERDERSHVARTLRRHDKNLHDLRKLVRPLGPPPNDIVRMHRLG
jgi:hypothetical protein